MTVPQSISQKASPTPECLHVIMPSVFSMPLPSRVTSLPLLFRLLRRHSRRGRHHEMGACIATGLGASGWLVISAGVASATSEGCQALVQAAATGAAAR